MQKDATTGQVTHERSRCVGCWSCIMACPFGAVRRDLCEGPVGSKCDRCASYSRPACVAACTTGALRHEPARLPVQWAEGGAGIRVARFVLFAVIPVVGLAVGMLVPTSGSALNHLLGRTAATAVLTALVLPLAGRAVWARVRRARWTAIHAGLGAIAVALALAHSAGRFGLNIQTAAALGLFLIVLTGAAYRYLRPPLLLIGALFGGREHAAPWPPSPEDALESAGILHDFYQAEARRVRAWSALLGRLERLTAACRPAHIILAILALGLIIAHAVVMTIVGAGNA